MKSDVFLSCIVLLKHAALTRLCCENVHLALGDLNVFCP